MELIFIIVFLFISFMFHLQNTKQIEEQEKKKQIPDLSVSLAGLISVVMNADGQATRSELAEVKYFLLNKFGEEKAKYLLKHLKRMLEREILNFRPYCLRVNRSFSYAERVDFLTLLFRIASTNNGICENEADILERIARHTAISQADFARLRILYAPNYNYSYSRPASAASGITVHSACRTLSVSETATPAEIKKAYRKLAMRYHPDRIDSDDTCAQREAAEKFRTINEAYKCLKREKCFS